MRRNEALILFMTQVNQPIYQLQYLVPPGYPVVDASFDQEIVDMTAKIKCDGKFGKVPDSALSIMVTVMENGTSIEIKKRDRLVYINFCCFEALHFQSVFTLIEDFYTRYNLGIPKRPIVPTWIHSIPIAHDILRENEIILCQKMTVSFFWGIYAQHLRRSNAMN